MRSQGRNKRSQIKQTALRRRTTESLPALFHLVPVLIKPQPARVNLERLFNHIPVRAFAAHAVVKSALVQHATLHLADTVDDLLSAQWHLLLQPFEKVRLDIAGQSQQVEERRFRSGVASAFEQLRYLVFIQSRNHRS